MKPVQSEQFRGYWGDRYQTPGAALDATLLCGLQWERTCLTKTSRECFVSWKKGHSGPRVWKVCDDLSLEGMTLAEFYATDMTFGDFILWMDFKVEFLRQAGQTGKRMPARS